MTTKMSLFKSKKTQIADAVKLANEALKALLSGSKRGSEDLAKHVTTIKTVLYGEDERAASPAHARRLAAEMIATKLTCPLVTNLSSYPFETKKDVAALVTNLLLAPHLAGEGEANEGDDDEDGVVTVVDDDDGGETAKIAAAAASGGEWNGMPPFVAHVLGTQAILDILVHGYETPDVALCCGSMLRACIHHEALASAILNSDRIWSFFQFVEAANFDVSSDALATFRELLTTHRDLVATFLAAQHDRFFESYRQLLRSSNYVTRRQSLKLLGEIIVHRKNFEIMSKYIGSKVDLMLMMNLLRDESKSIQYEAFHVFKVFVANPKKPADIVDILVRNRERLILFLSKFRNEITDDQFKREKAYLVKEIESIEGKAEKSDRKKSKKDKAVE